jgi:RNA ligase (TIGR02306 family)
MRKMASLQRIKAIKDIPDADLIQAYQVNDWWVVDQKGKYLVGDFVVYCEVDSWIPHMLAPFLSRGNEPRVYVTEDSTQIIGERLRTIKLKKQLSQGLLLDCSKVLGVYYPVYFYESSRYAINVFTVSTDGTEESNFVYEGEDLSDKLGIVKYEIPVPAQLAGMARGTFPSSVPKTDQERIQNLSGVFSEYISDVYEVTEKCHGQSATYLLDSSGEFHVCSRNLDLKYDENNSFWKAAIVYDIEQKMKDMDLIDTAIQGELVGEGINGNQYKLSLDFFVFDIYDTEKQQYYSAGERQDMVRYLGLKHVPFICVKELTSSDTIPKLLQEANGLSTINKSKREGFVYKSLSNPSKSFKVVSDEWLLKNE